MWCTKTLELPDQCNLQLQFEISFNKKKNHWLWSLICFVLFSLSFSYRLECDEQLENCQDKRIQINTETDSLQIDCLRYYFKWTAFIKIVEISVLDVPYFIPSYQLSFVKYWPTIFRIFITKLNNRNYWEEFFYEHWWDKFDGIVFLMKI